MTRSFSRVDDTHSTEWGWFVPFFNKYFLRRNPSTRLTYGTTVIHLEMIALPKAPGNYLDYWVYRARKIGETEDKVCILCKVSGGRYYLEALLFTKGFVLEIGSPAAKILDRLVKDGCAECRSATRQDFKSHR